LLKLLWAALLTPVWAESVALLEAAVETALLAS
jgi:hypothetical protein